MENTNNQNGRKADITEIAPKLYLAAVRAVGKGSNIKEGNDLLTGQKTTLRRVIGFVPTTITEMAQKEGISLQKLTEVSVIMAHKEAIKAIKANQ
jgi:hypothetical protein